MSLKSSSSEWESMKISMESGKYVRYTAEQVEALERLYNDCPKPSSLRRQQLIRECPILSNIEPKQIKVWFQNRRCREKQRKEAARLQTVNKKLNAMNRLLMEENERLQKQVSHLVYENGYLRQQIQAASFATTDNSCESAVTSGAHQHHLTPQHPPRDAGPAGFVSIAEETLTQFISKAKETAVDWIQMPGMKPGPDSIGIVTISNTCPGVAARAGGFVGLEPAKVAEILKDRPSWLHDCRSLEVLHSFPTGKGGTIEILYTQMYAPTTLASAHHLWTLRYTSFMEDGSLVICERSLTGYQAPQHMASVSFVKAEMFPSGYLIKPCEGGGSIILIVDHLDWEPWSIREIIRPIYDSSAVLAQKMTITALRHLKQVAQEASGEVVLGWGRQPAALRAFSLRLCRGFNEAVNSFVDDGWSLLSDDGAEGVVITINSTPNNLLGFQLGVTDGLTTLGGGILCAKASMLLQNVPPSLLVRFLREHRSEWSDCNFDGYSSASSLKNNAFNLPTSRGGLMGSQVILPLAHTVENEEFLEVIKLERHGLTNEEALLSKDMFLLQLCSGVDENATGSCSQLLFAPIDATFSDDAPLLPSGFRIIPMESGQDAASPNRTLDLASSLEIGPAGGRGGTDNAGNPNNLRSVLTIAFQFTYQCHMQEHVAAMASQYVRRVIASVQRVAMALSPQHSSQLGMRSLPGAPEAGTLARWICQSYRIHLGIELSDPNCEHNDSMLKLLWHHPDAILCCSCKSVPIFTFANQARLDMLEITLVALQDISLKKKYSMGM